MLPILANTLEENKLPEKVETVIVELETLRDQIVTEYKKDNYWKAKSVHGKDGVDLIMKLDKHITDLRYGLNRNMPQSVTVNIINYGDIKPQL